MPEIAGYAVKTEMELIREAVESWTLERTSEVTGVSADDSKHLAHLYTQEGNVQTDMKFGLNHYNNGMYISKCINTLLLVAGQMGRSGSGLYTGEPNFGEGNVMACLQLPSTKGEVPQGVGGKINWSDFFNIVPSGQKLAAPYPIKAFYASCTNIVSNQTEQNETCLLYTSRCV